MSAAPTFSVVIGAYQKAAVIGEAVESALAQTEPPHEVVICDDGSTDDLDAALAPFAGRIVLVRQANRGAGAARNSALRAATGEFAAILDADDVFLPRRLERLGGLARTRPELDILATDAWFDVDGELVGRFNDGDNLFPDDNQRAAILERCFLFAPAFRRERLLALGGFDETIATADDWDAWVRLVLDGAVAGFVDEPLIRYRLSRDSLSANRARSFRDRVRVLEKAAGRPDLTADERRLVERLRGELEQRARLAEAEAALRSGAPDSRRRALAVAVSRRSAPAARLKALAAAVAPGLAARALARRGRGASYLAHARPLESVLREGER